MKAEFWLKGYTATTVEDLAEQTGYSQSFIYTNFGKKGLFEAAFYFYLENYTDPFLHSLMKDSRGIEAFRDKLSKLGESLIENAMLNRLSFNPKFRDGIPTMFISGNDQEAKKTVTGILNQFGWETADMGKAEAARAIEPLAILWCIPGFLHNEWNHAFKLLKQ